MNLNRLLKRRDAVYGFCAVWILLFHIYRNISLPAVPVLSNALRLGNLGVDIFLFLSGICLSRSVARHQYTGKKWFIFYQRRCFRVLLPYLIVAIPFFCWAAIFERSGGLIRRVALFFSDLFYLTFLIYGTQTIWFVLGIMICYLLFPLLYRCAVKASCVQKLMLLLGILCFAFVAAFLPYLHNLEIVWARLPIFVIGAYFGTYKEPSNYSKKSTLPLCVASVLTILLLGWAVSSNWIPSRSDAWLLIRWLVYVPVTLAFLYLVSHFGPQSRVLAWLGTISLEIYLVHITAIRLLRFYGMLDLWGGWTYLVLPLFTVPAAWLVHKLAGCIQKRIGGNAA